MLQGGDVPWLILEWPSLVPCIHLLGMKLGTHDITNIAYTPTKSGLKPNMPKKCSPRPTVMLDLAFLVKAGTSLMGSATFENSPKIEDNCSFCVIKQGFLFVE